VLTKLLLIKIRGVMVDSFKEALSRNIDIERRNMYQYSKG